MEILAEMEVKYNLLEGKHRSLKTKYNTLCRINAENCIKLKNMLTDTKFCRPTKPTTFASLPIRTLPQNVNSPPTSEVNDFLLFSSIL